MRRRVVGLFILAVLAVAACSGSGESAELGLLRDPGAEPVAAAAAADPATTVTQAPPPATAATTTTVAPTTTAASAAPAPPPPVPPPPPPPPTAYQVGMAPYRGLGTWVDVYDWSHTYGKDGPLVVPADVDRMANLGVQTLYIQASKWDAPADVLEPERLLPIIERAHQLGMAVVAWYLPTLEDTAADLRRLLAIAALPVEGLAVDIESTKVADVAERNRRLIDLSASLRRALPGRVLGAIPLPPVVMEVINPRYWPGFPWREIAPYYDVWLPMSYQSNRTRASGYREGYRYTAENIDRMRVNLGWLDAPVHPIGGIADATSPTDVRGMLRASVERAAIGGSLYDWRTSGNLDVWRELAGFRSAP